MIDWDDVRYFLAVAREESVRGGSEFLKVNHSTVLRRISQLEERLGAQLFERMPSGYRLTAAGDEILELAEKMEACSQELETRVFGRDQSIRGLLRITLPPPMAMGLLMPNFAEFAALHPDIELEILPSDEPVNLTNRAADVAIRVVYDRNALPSHLHGIAGPELSGGIYVAKKLLEAWRAGEISGVRWIVKNIHGIPDWVEGCEIPISDVPVRTTDTATQLAAAIQGLGIAALPCFIGDMNSSLVRVPGTKLRVHGRVWVLTYGETRKTKRVKLFTQFVADSLTSYNKLLIGDSQQAYDSH